MKKRQKKKLCPDLGLRIWKIQYPPPRMQPDDFKTWKRPTLTMLRLDSIEAADGCGFSSEQLRTCAAGSQNAKKEARSQN